MLLEEIHQDLVESMAKAEGMYILVGCTKSGCQPSEYFQDDSAANNMQNLLKAFEVLTYDLLESLSCLTSRVSDDIQKVSPKKVSA